MEYHQPIITLIVTLLVFHVFFVWIYPQSKKFWKTIDYFWISLGVIGIIGSTFSLRSEYSKGRNTMNEYYLSQSYNNLIESADWNKRYYSPDGTGFDYSEFEDTVKVERFLRSETFFQYFSSLAKQLKDTIIIEKNLQYIDTLSIKFEKFKDNINDEYIVKTARNVDNNLKELNQSKSEYIENIKLGRRGEVGWTFLFISPYLFAVAIAIRLTKVTAELRELN